jgi:hypothetical protein
MTPMQKWHANASFCEGGVSAARWAQRFRRSRGGGPALNDCSQSFGRRSTLATQGAFAALAPRAVSKIAMTFLGPAPYVAISHMDVSRFAAPNEQPDYRKPPASGAGPPGESLFLAHDSAARDSTGRTGTSPNRSWRKSKAACSD